ncbi:sigma-70 family RNA polymerase sigma factor [Romboutsia sp. CE17]|uniref:sigma-70 family RNA polymerase sigma factor n=1 Tax=Romboutsia sp. CE17 TaxID=2724150 RepID=UPI001442B9C4|nr:sigma-70 family RNA polymerase sigma factor [Romboutsia sp. CE17]QJA08771.1 sigma-70 family RNA polymerase sigma factor [Romboutsia sp. CE17]
MNTVKLVRKSKKGNNLAFSTLIKSYEKDLYKVAIAMTKNDDDALDCIQEAILQAYISIKDLRQDEYFKTWLIKILINKCNALLKKNKKILNLDVSIAENDKVEQSDRLELKDSINNLDSNLKIIVILYYYEDMSIKDISESLNIPQGTIKSRLSRARSKLKEMLSIDEEVL